MAYDAGRGVTVLSSGWRTHENIGANDTWEWDGTAWTENTTTGTPVAPTGFEISLLVYDSGRGVVIDYMTTLNRQTLMWDYDGTTWRKINTTGPVETASMAYDSARKKTVLLEDHTGITWLWGGAFWRRQYPANSPPALEATRMVYDSHREVAVVFGGMHYQSYTVINDTWEWDGSNWTEMEPANKPPARYWHAMAYDSARKVTVMFGGSSGGDDATFNDTWEWDGTDWKEIQSTEKPAPRLHHSMAYDSKRGVTVLFGGHGEMDDTWEYGGPP
jgi:hypothetical protein